MPQNNDTDLLLKTQVDAILQSKKYRLLGIPEETLRDIVSEELQHYRSGKDAQKSVRHKLHNIMAPYLGDPDYAREQGLMDQMLKNAGPDDLRSYCTGILQTHASTRERLPILSTLYDGIFAHTGRPQVILDLACGLNPFAVPWMGLPPGVQYYAYDIHRPRINLINQFFEKVGLDPLAEVRDILLDPPEVKADVAFLFKEAHRLEQRRRGCNLPLWTALKVRHLLISLPASSLSGHHDLAERQRHLVRTILGDHPWPVTELIYGNEMFFCIEKNT
jgi:16S rRNA (guanine(1405)-N(7))-methyltransferase